jgi:hypothetical protein
VRGGATAAVLALGASLAAVPAGVLILGSAVADAEVASGSCASSPLGAKSGALSLSEVARLAHGAGFRGRDLVVAVAVVMPESGGDPVAQNPSGAAGLWQVLPSAHPELFAGRDWRDPAVNAGMAFEVYSRAGGFSPWVNAA